MAGNATAQDIQKIYADLFGRTAEKRGLDYWQNEANTKGLNAMALRDQIGRAGMSPEAQAAAQRLVDTGESQYVGGGIEWNPTQTATQQIAVQPAVTAAPSIGDSDIQKAYSDFFGRTAEQSGVDYWQNEAKTKGLNLSDLRDQIAEAGKDPNAQSAAQKLIDSGQSQITGQGQAWTPAQISNQPATFAEDQNVRQVYDDLQSKTAAQDANSGFLASNVLDYLAPAITQAQGQSVDAQQAGTSNLINSNNISDLASTYADLTDQSANALAQGNTEAASAANDASIFGGSAGNGFLASNALDYLSPIVSQIQSPGNTALSIQDPNISQVYADLQNQTVGQDLTASNTQGQDQTVYTGGSNTFDETAGQQGTNSFLENVNDPDLLSSLAQSQATQETTTPSAVTNSTSRRGFLNFPGMSGFVNTLMDAVKQTQEQAPATATGLNSLSLPSTQTPDITNQMSEAGKDPAIRAVMQQLVDSGQSQYIGGGSVWNATQPSYYSYGGRVSPLSTLARYR